MNSDDKIRFGGWVRQDYRFVRNKLRRFWSSELFNNNQTYDHMPEDETVVPAPVEEGTEEVLETPVVEEERIAE